MIAKTGSAPIKHSRSFARDRNSADWPRASWHIQFQQIPQIETLQRERHHGTSNTLGHAGPQLAAKVPTLASGERGHASRRPLNMSGAFAPCR